MKDGRTCYDTVNSLNQNIFIPDFQREYAWNSEKIKKLFDSILNEYPIGSIVLWEYNSDPTDLDFLYSFIENWTEFIPEDRERFNRGYDKIASNRPILLEDRDQLDTFNNRNSLPFELVVDGQQRLTSLNIGLKGGILYETGDGEVGIKNLYIDILSLSDKAKSDIPPGKQDEMKFDIDFFKETDVFIEKDGALYYRISHLTESEHVKNDESHRYRSECMDICRDYFGDKYDEETDTIRDGLRLLYERLCYNELNITTYETSSIDEVLQLFLRINIEDKQLEDSDILLAILTSIWGQSRGDTDPINARKELRGFVETLNREYESIGNIETEHIAKILLSLSDPGLGVELDQRAINGIDSTDIEDTKEYWDEGDIQASINKTLTMISDWNYNHLISSSSDITYLFPIIYFFYHNPEAEYIETIGPGVNNFTGPNYLERSEYLNTVRIQYWLCVAMLHSNYTTQRHPSLTRRMFETIKGSDTDTFPIKELNEELWKESGFNPTLVPSDVENALKQNMSKQKPISILTLLEIPFTYPSEDLQLDHLQPKALLNDDDLLEERGVGDRKKQRIQNTMDSLGNRTLLEAKANNLKGDEELYEWIDMMIKNLGKDETIDFLEANYIPKDEDLYKIEEFEEFMRERRECIVEALEKKYMDLYGSHSNPNTTEGYQTPEWYTDPE